MDLHQQIPSNRRLPRLRPPRRRPHRDPTAKRSPLQALWPDVLSSHQRHRSLYGMHKKPRSRDGRAVARWRRIGESRVLPVPAGWQAMPGKPCTSSERAPSRRKRSSGSGVGRRVSEVVREKNIVRGAEEALRDGIEQAQRSTQALIDTPAYIARGSAPPPFRPCVVEVGGSVYINEPGSRTVPPPPRGRRWGACSCTTGRSPRPAPGRCGGGSLCGVRGVGADLRSPLVRLSRQALRVEQRRVDGRLRDEGFSRSLEPGLSTSPDTGCPRSCGRAARTSCGRRGRSSGSAIGEVGRSC